MYSVVLMAAMTMPAEQPTFGKLFKGGTSCTGCTGGSCTGCTGQACAGGAAYAGPGCTGYAGWTAGQNGFNGSGYSCGGCGGCGGKFLGFKQGGCWSDNGYKTSFACHGAGACYGYAYAGVGYGFAGCYGSCYGSMTNYFSYWAQPMAANVGVGINVRVAQSTIPAPAAVVITIPADAKLIANGHATKQMGTERRFSTPELQPGISYSYTFTAEIIRNDKPMTETIEVEVTAGAESHATFAKLIAATPKESVGIVSK